MQEKKVHVTSGELTYLQTGSGRPLLYLHPAGGVRKTKVLEGLGRAFSLYVPVFPGFEGTAVHPELKTRRALGLMAAEFTERVIGGRCDVMGWSFGGAVALWLAIERPQLVDHLVLECPAGLASIDKRIKRVTRALLEHYAAEDGKDEALLARVGEIGHTTLILQGTEDGTIPEASARFLKSLLRRSFLVYVWQAGHDLEMDQPERVLGLAKEFLQHSDAFMVNRGNI